MLDMNQEILFAKKTAATFFEEVKRTLKKEIASLPSSDVIDRMDAHIDLMIRTKRIKPIKLLVEEIVRNPAHVKLVNRGSNEQPEWERLIAFSFFIPFNGDARLFDVQPNLNNVSPPIGKVHQKMDHFLVLDFHVTPRNSEMERVQKAFESWLALCEQFIDALNQEINAFDTGFETFVTTAYTDEATLRSRIKRLNENLPYPMDSNLKS